MPLPASVRAAVFDLDGTLIDSLQDLADSANAMLTAAGFPTHETDRYRTFVGDGARTLVQRVLPESSRDEETVDRCLQRYLQEYDRRWNLATCPYEGIPTLLGELASRHIQLAVLSNKSHAFTVRCVNLLLPGGSSFRWARIVGLREGMPRKPDPTALQDLLRSLQVSPAETLYLGDTNTDMRTAVAAGAHPIGVLWGFRSGKELLEAGAEWLLREPIDLIPLLPGREGAT